MEFTNFVIKSSRIVNARQNKTRFLVYLVEIMDQVDIQRTKQSILHAKNSLVDNINSATTPLT